MKQTMLGGGCRLDGVSQACRGGRNVREKFLGVESNWRNFLSTRVVFQAKKMTFIFYQPTGNDVYHLAQCLAQSQGLINVSSN